MRDRKMVRKIYSNAIYLRKKQNERKVYQRMNNVLPTDIQGGEEEQPVVPVVPVVPPVVEETQADEPNTESEEIPEDVDSEETEDEE